MDAPVVNLRAVDGWVNCGTGFATGTAFHHDRSVRSATLAELVDKSEKSLEEIAGNLIGEFALVRAEGFTVELAVDPIRSRPLFYACDGGQVSVSDHPRWIVPSLDGLTFDPMAEYEFLLSGTVSGRQTLYEEIKSVQAGEIVTIEQDSREPSVTTASHFDYEPTGTSRLSKRSFLEELDQVLKRVTDRLIRVADGRQIAIALSGGYDSRLVACLLARRDYPRVMAFSFGRQGNQESEVSKRVASQLGLAWAFVEYSNDRWRDWYESAERRDYFTATFDLCSIPSIGACPAIQALKASSILDDDALLVGGDSITTTGEHLPLTVAETGTLDRNHLIRTIRELQYSLWRHDTADKERIEGLVGGAIVGGDSANLAPSALEKWDWRERQSKFIISPDEFGFWGYRSWHPLFDREFMAFWQGVPARFRAQKSLHKEYVDELFAEQTESRQPTMGEGGGSPAAARFKKRVADTPLGPVLKPVYDAARRTSPYDANDLAQFGILSKSQYDRLYTGRENVHSFKVLDITGRESISPPVSRFPPDEGVIQYDPSISDWLTETRRSLPWFPMTNS